MIEATSFELSQAATDAALRLFLTYAPDAAPIVAPYLGKLFAAQEGGHTFIELNSKEVTSLERAQPVVGSIENAPLVLDGNRLFFGRWWQVEENLAKEIVRLAKGEVDEIDWEQAGTNLQNWFVKDSSEGQRDAAALALLKNLMFIIGGPGTGKTTAVATLLALIGQSSKKETLPRIRLVAPTGKAAAHMARSLHGKLNNFQMRDAVKQHLMALEGQTVHRLLELRPPKMQPAFNREQPLSLDVLVVDEASMLDETLLLQLLQAVPDGAKVILLGDENQLPSVGTGAVLQVLPSETVLSKKTAQKLRKMLPKFAFGVAEGGVELAENIAKLTVSYRFDDKSGIGRLAADIVVGNGKKAWQQFAEFPQELSVRQGSVCEKASCLFEQHSDYWQAVDQGGVAEIFSHQADVVVLAAWRDDAQAFNEAYRYVLQQHGRVRVGEQWFVGQMLMIEQNDYALNLFNGDVGIVLDNGGTLAAWFAEADGYRSVPLARLPECSTAFALTVHKSQGSEYNQVWLLPPSASEDTDDGVMTRPLIYTAVTRAKQRFVFWGSESVFQMACETLQPRRTFLKELIKRNWAK